MKKAVRENRPIVHKIERIEHKACGMRAATFMALLLIALLQIPPTGAQNPAPVLEDSEDDVIVGDDPATTQSNRFPGIDLRALWIYEDAAEFRFSFVMGAVYESDGPQQDAGRVTLDFVLDEIPYSLQINRPVNPGAGYFAVLYIDDNISGTPVPLDADPTTATLTADVARDLLLDSRGLAIQSGQILSDAKVEAFAHIGSHRDFMPDEGIVSALYEASFGPPQSGNARLSSPSPIRSSNGEAAVFVFEVLAENLGNARESYDVVISEVPETWTVDIPVPAMSLDAGEVQRFPILVSVPFAHVHGTTDSALLELQSRDNAENIGRVEVGIQYLATPQPSGHHPRVYLHSTELSDETMQTANQVQSQATGALFMNTLEDDEADEEVPIRGRNYIWPPAPFQWVAYLEPQLLLGLDFNVGEPVHLEASFSSELPIVDGVVEARLLLLQSAESTTARYPPYGGREAIILAEEIQDGISTDGEDFELVFDMEALPESDFIEHELGQDLVLEITLSDAVNRQAAAEAPYLLPGGWFDLPANDYSDRSAETFDALIHTTLSVQPTREIKADAGTTAQFVIELTNDDPDQGHSFSASALGLHSQRTRILEGISQELEALDAGRIVVEVEIPNDAIKGSRIDAIVSIQQDGNPTQSALVKLGITIEDGVTPATLVEGGEHESPSTLGPIGLALLLGLAIVMRSRRR